MKILDLALIASKGIWPYEWHWKKRHPERKGQMCKIIVRGRMNSILVRFPDGFETVTSRFAVRKRK